MFSFWYYSHQVTITLSWYSASLHPRVLTESTAFSSLDYVCCTDFFRAPTWLPLIICCDLSKGIVFVWVYTPVASRAEAIFRMGIDENAILFIADILRWCFETRYEHGFEHSANSNTSAFLSISLSLSFCVYVPPSKLIQIQLSIHYMCNSRFLQVARFDIVGTAVEQIDEM